MLLREFVRLVEVSYLKESFPKGFFVCRCDLRGHKSQYPTEDIIIVLSSTATQTNNNKHKHRQTACFDMNEDSYIVRHVPQMTPETDIINHVTARSAKSK